MAILRCHSVTRRLATARGCHETLILPTGPPSPGGLPCPPPLFHYAAQPLIAGPPHPLTSPHTTGCRATRETSVRAFIPCRMPLLPAPQASGRKLHVLWELGCNKGDPLHLGVPTITITTTATTLGVPRCLRKHANYGAYHCKGHDVGGVRRQNFNLHPCYHRRQTTSPSSPTTSPNKRQRITQGAVERIAHAKLCACPKALQGNAHL